MENTEDTGMELVLTEDVNGVMCEFYQGNGEVWVTGEQLGQALEYANPKKAIQKIHSTHRERMDKYSKIMKRVSPNLGGTQETRCYCFEGWLETCRWSRQPKADFVMDTLYAIFKKLLTAGRVTIDELPGMIRQLALSNKTYAVEQLAPALKDAGIEQTQFMRKLTGLGNADFPNNKTTIGQAFEKRIRMNDTAALSRRHWRKAFTLLDLPDYITSEKGMFQLEIERLSRREKMCPNVVNYAGKIYFNEEGMVEIMKLGIKRGIISREDAAGWMTKKTGRKYD